MSLIDTALEAQLEIIHVIDGPNGPSVYEWLARNKEVELVDSITGKVQPLRMFDEAAKDLVGIMAHAPTYVVTADMGLLIDHATEQMQEQGDLPIPTASEIPTPSGFLYLEKPMRLMVYGPEPFVRSPIRAMLWYPGHSVHWASGERLTGPSVLMIVFKDVEDDDVLPGLGIIKPHDLTAWTLDLKWRQAQTHAEHDAFMAQGTDAEMGLAHPAGGHWRRWAYTVWHLAMQRIQPRKAGRGVRRRWIRSIGPPPNYGEVRVVDLRRYATRGGVIVGSEDPDYKKQWSHRWVVTGHWRDQPYGPGRSLRKTIWIDPFVKGPADRPLIVRDDVFMFRR